MQNKKLSLKKEQIRTLNESEVNLLDSVVGGTITVTIKVSAE
ncbi:hypothetical protein [Hyalangium gracile]|nr:hypothetical protein [Hyalangium gracile]